MDKEHDIKMAALKHHHDRELEGLKHQYARDLERQKHDLKWIEVSTEATIRNGQAAIRGAFLINGGGAVAALTLIGNLASRSGRLTLDPTLVVSAFVIGIALAVAAACCSYMSQMRYTVAAGILAGTRDDDTFSASYRSADLWMFRSAGLTVGSVVAFIAGCMRSALELSRLAG